MSTAHHVDALDIRAVSASLSPYEYGDGLMSVNVGAVRRAFSIAISDEIDDLKERLDWADRDPTVAEMMCFTDREVAYILNVSARTVSRYVQRGELRATYLTAPGRTRRFTLPDVKAFMRTRITESN